MASLTNNPCAYSGEQQKQMRAQENEHADQFRQVGCPGETINT